MSMGESRYPFCVSIVAPVPAAERGGLPVCEEGLSSGRGWRMAQVQRDGPTATRSEEGQG